VAERSPAFQAIETEYAGVMFRSRLEARWAVFFDTLGIRWDYEPEGYQFEDGTRYVPDFWLRKKPLLMSGFFEVKPAGGMDDEALRRARLLAHAAREDVWIVESSYFPDARSRAQDFPLIYSIGWMDVGAPLYEVEHCMVGQCITCGKIAVSREYWRCAKCSKPKDVPFYINTDPLMAAYEAARTARFWEPRRRRG